MQAIESVEEIQEAVRHAQRLRVCGAGSKPALSAHNRAGTVLDLSGLRGVQEYQPDEYTFTAWAGTPLADVAAMLAEEGQYLPFDPPLTRQGATLGGTVATGLSGPGRYRYGGVRDFLIGIRFVDGQGQHVRGGGAVVKNAAGFDFPKLFVGSLGRLGVLTELTFKVFPQAPAFLTVAAHYPSLDGLLAGLGEISRRPVDLQALDFAPAADDGWTLWARLGGLAPALDARARPLQAAADRADVLRGPEEAALWQQASSMDWLPEGAGLVKIPLTPARVPLVEAALAAHPPAARHYSVGGNLLWLGWPGDLSVLDELLRALALRGVPLTGPGRPDAPLLGQPFQNVFLQRIAAALDPAGKFGADEL